MNGPRKHYAWWNKLDTKQILYASNLYEIPTIHKFVGKEKQRYYQGHGTSLRITRNIGVFLLLLALPRSLWFPDQECRLGLRQ